LLKLKSARRNFAGAFFVRDEENAAESVEGGAAAPLLMAYGFSRKFAAKWPH
jgi:hypothetical protein